ncbi:MAG: hypothetical protein ABI728_12140, partial [Betaproteobacteria bacterium]
DNTVSMLGNTSRAFAASEFGFSDVDSGDSLSAVRIDSLSLAVGSTLRLSGVDVIAGQVILGANISNLIFTPAANTSGVAYATFTFSVRDQANAFAPAPATMTIDIVAAIATPWLAPNETTIPFDRTPPPVTTIAPPISGPADGKTLRLSSADADALESSSRALDSSRDDLKSDAGETRAPSFIPEGFAVLARYAPNAETGTRSSHTFGGTPIILDGQVFTVPDGEIASVRYESASNEMVNMQTIARSLHAIGSPAFRHELDRLRDNLTDESKMETTIVASTASLGVSLSVGYVFWLLRGGALVSSMLSSLPAWRLVDPMPILSQLEDDDDDDDDSLESMLARTDASRPVDDARLVEGGGDSQQTETPSGAAPLIAVAANG